MVLADHFEKGQKPARAVRWLRVAANQAMEADDLKAALARVERGVRLGASGDDLAELRCVESEARYWTGEYAEAERAAREAQKCEDAKLALRAVSALIQALGPQAKYEEIGEAAKKLEERPAQPELLNAWLEAKFNAAAFLASAGQFDQRRKILVLLESEREHLDTLLVGRIESTKAHLARTGGRPAESVNGFLRAWEFFECAGQRRVGAQALGNAASTLLEVGRLEEAEDQIRKLWDIAERIGLRGILGATLYLLSTCLTDQGRLDEARDLNEQAIRLTAELNDQYWGVYAQCWSSVIEHRAGNHLTADKHARDAVRMAENNPGLRPYALALAARAALGQRRISEAHEWAKDAYEQLESLGDVTDGEETIRLAYAECLLAQSDRVAAKEVLLKARNRIDTKAKTIDILDWRRSFLTRILENRRTIELADQLGIPAPD